MSCVSATDCTAVGDQARVPSGRDLGFIMSWNGKTWSTVPSPNRSGDDFLSGVSCVSSSECTAAGVDYFASGGGSRPLVESWNGTRWSIEPTPNVKAASTVNILAAASCASAGFCDAVGWDGPRTLAETGKPGG